MPDGVLDLIKAGGDAALPLAVASWGGYYLPKGATYPQPFNVLVPWTCFMAMFSGALAASIMAIRKAVSRRHNT
jgi:hypothetical protein